MAERNRNMAIACEVCGTADNVIMFYRRKNLCNRCKQFSRRITKATTPIVCNCTGECSPSGTCREGRLAKCAEIGLNIFDEKLEKLFKNLMDWNERRLFNFTNSQPTEDLSLEEIMNRGTIEFTERSPSDHNLTSHQWASLQNITTIEFMKGFHFVKFLNPEETTAFIKKTYFKTTIFFMAMASFQSNRDSMIFPGNKDVFPEESVDIQQRHDKLFKRIRCLLISKFIEFRVTKEEFLLLSVLISCDPNIIMEPNSDDGSSAFTPNQKRRLRMIKLNNL
ncbi:hypothetical protein GCK72_009867 [Caenorhabditis remanei]|uniref:NR LBD domain-containing protein n=1 Tax=Caenorhabditis remanei TaxID=31234 RepID=A0A6A5H3N4_CAERE|nr:hypothetical protein GCK72_009867 [Caenorhabditis remanei]KAF1761611.1 hypothetical protein GCK72_009867 [Caenorhabditis remanei]